MTEPSGEVLKLFYSPAACTILRKLEGVKENGQAAW
jgi:hypothetical protein